MMAYCVYRGGYLFRTVSKVIVTALVHEEYKPVARLEQGLRGRVIDIPTTQNCPNGLTSVSLKRFDNSGRLMSVWGVGLEFGGGGGVFCLILPCGCRFDNFLFLLTCPLFLCLCETRTSTI